MFRLLNNILIQHSFVHLSDMEGKHPGIILNEIYFCTNMSLCVQELHTVSAAIRIDVSLISQIIKSAYFFILAKSHNRISKCTRWDV